MAAQEVGVPQVVDTAITDDFDSLQPDTPAAQKVKEEKEVVVVGYGAMKKKQLTMAVSTINANTFSEKPVVNVAQAMQGNATGVQVVQSSGKPGGAFDVRIRGISSINSGNSPLYVIDGIQTTSMDGINVADITSIQILKDATATAIYGVNGSSGVVIITTKRGKVNKPSLSFDSYIGFSNIVSNVDVLNLQQYKDYIGTVKTDYLTTANDAAYTGIDTDWADKVFQTGIDQNYNLSYSGGNESLRYYTSVGYQDTKGIVDPSKFNRLSAKINLDGNIYKWLKFNAGINYINTNSKSISDNNSIGQGGAIMSTLVTPVFLPVYGTELNVLQYEADGVTPKDGYKDGQFALNPYQSGWENPVSLLTRENETNVNRYLTNLSFDVSLTKNLVWKPMISSDVTRSENTQFIDAYRTSYGRANGVVANMGRGSNSVEKYNFMNFENTLTYTLKKDIHDLNVMVGNSLQKNTYKGDYNSAQGFSVNASGYNYEEALTKNSLSYRESKVNTASFFGRVIYSLKNKYIITGVFRASGASQLSEGNKWGYFPGVSAAWIVSNESFLQDSRIFSEVKLRGGWGKTGNISGIPAYSAFDLSYTDLLTDALSLDQIGNPDLTWETNTDSNIGLDLGFIDNRIKLTVDAYYRETTDLLQKLYFPGFSQPYYYNAGSIENRGLEIGLNTQNITGNFKWNTSFNISFNKNEITSLGYNKIIDLQNLSTVNEKVVRIMEGVPVSSFYGYVVDKVDPATGSLLYKDLDGNGSVDANDRKIIGDANPDFTFGLNNEFKYKGFNLNVLVTGSQGNEIYNASRMDLMLMNDYKNQSVDVLNRWTTPGQITDVPKVNDANAQHISDRFVEDGSYIRLKSVTLGYTFPKEVFKKVSLNLYVTGQNLVTWTDYKGFDPEVGAFNDKTNTTAGIDLGTYPQVRTYIFGLKANF